VTEPNDTAAETSRAPSRGRLIIVGAGVLIACAVIVTAAIWLLMHPAAPSSESREPAATAPAPTNEPQPSEPATDEHDAEPHRHGVADAEGEPAGQSPGVDDVQVAVQWAAVLLGWTPQERDATAAAERAAAAAPGVHLEHLAGAVFNHAAAWGAGAGHPHTIEAVEVTDPSIWPAGWVVLDAAVTTAADPQAGVPHLVLHVTCEVQVVDGQVVTAVIGDGAAWIEYPA
jgi:hypothetical protein